jgi:hypothetical protein
MKHGLAAGKVTDLPGVSISIVPLLARAGVKALHIGTNPIGYQPFTSFPDVDNLPQVFRWKHPATGDEVIVMNERGYGKEIVPGPGLKFDHALRWFFKGDNSDAPSAASVTSFWKSVRQQFPNAKLKASTLDEFSEELWQIRDRLPVVTGEIGNCWLPQMATDPWRLRALREVGRLRKQSIESGEMNADDVDLRGYSTR